MTVLVIVSLALLGVCLCLSGWEANKCPAPSCEQCRAPAWGRFAKDVYVSGVRQEVVSLAQRWEEADLFTDWRVARGPGQRHYSGRRWLAVFQKNPLCMEPFVCVGTEPGSPTHQVYETQHGTWACCWRGLVMALKEGRAKESGAVRIMGHNVIWVDYHSVLQEGLDVKGITGEGKVAFWPGIAVKSEPVTAPVGERRLEAIWDLEKQPEGGPCQ